MENNSVGAKILNIITESLYDKPVVVFREYVQNSVDSFQNVEEKGSAENLICNIWCDANNLYFLDNGTGIKEELFLQSMSSIAHSSKNQARNIGYKGIGRLSGLPYCDTLTFINILSYQNNTYQLYEIYGEKYEKIKMQDDIDESLTFEELMKQISITNNPVKDVESILAPYADMFSTQDTGFLVILKKIKPILQKEIQVKNPDNFLLSLGWLLPVKFKDELLDPTFETKDLFLNLTEPDKSTKLIPAKSYNILYERTLIERPIGKEMLRRFTCKTDLTYAVGFYSFNEDRIAIESKNIFSGIKLYLDNILLCDENEIVPILHKYGLISHSVNELLQTVKGLGVIIYITDKVNISANARRTFIEVTDDDSFQFLEIIANFINRIYDTRYAISRYNVLKKDTKADCKKLEQMRTIANNALKKLVEDKIIINLEEETLPKFDNLSDTDKKKAIKSKLSKFTNSHIKEYLLQANYFDYSDPVPDFLKWIYSSHKV